ncbi:hypothetical protein EHI45_13555 [Rhizobium leguminosarum]|jgi:hypothetical protein|uniref:hypothetical protein n=1 Tax=Rhizobium TaxID=379 RepID=UPI000FEC82AC|nr:MULTISPECIES: hypothetical protein [Rhizobium]TBY60378.1 hypothetical protein E0H46_31440 [Rhizobium leguminosarum bv. viciae]MBY3483306.1 hypothetical protein [Rhizobium laguerreae]NEH83061.1 hypothetical protein [Rhizobium ruizarguesonis]NEJ27009.1 hypothetical protein [Rhizobium ruizarguesonis]RWX14308.1 hypothetical protein EHI45_13555 [Rhizobium leguminosarum]
MALVAIISICICAVVLYFCVGIVIRFVWEWWILVISTPTLVALGLLSGWIGAFIALIAWFYTVSANNDWHSKPAYFAGASWIDRKFNFSDV